MLILCYLLNISATSVTWILFHRLCFILFNSDTFILIVELDTKCKYFSNKSRWQKSNFRNSMLKQKYRRSPWIFSRQNRTQMKDNVCNCNQMHVNTHTYQFHSIKICYWNVSIKRRPLINHNKTKNIVLLAESVDSEPF